MLKMPDQVDVNRNNSLPISVLCYSPYNYWALHGMWEITILHALKLRGADVKYVLCDGVYSDCDMFWAATNPRGPQSRCNECMAEVTKLVQNMGMQFEWLSQYLKPDEIEKARTWSNNLNVKDYMAAKYHDWEIGEWVKSSVNSHFRISDLDLNIQYVREGYQSYLYSGLVASFALSRLLDEYKPNVVFQFNGRQSSTRVMFEIAKKRGLYVVCHERGMQSESISLFTDSIMSLTPIKKLWKEWGQIPLTRDQLENIHQHMVNRQYGKNLNWKTFSPSPQDYKELRRKLGFSDDRPLWVFFTSSDDELADAPDWKGVFDNQLTCIKKTVRYVERHPELDLVVRVHPNTGGKKATGSNIKQLQELEQLLLELPPNVKMVMPEDPISSYSLMDIATLGLIYSSTVGLEMACKGKHIIVTSGSYVSDLPFVQTVKSIESYEKILDRMLALPLMAESIEIKRMAFRFAYSLFFRMNIPFPLVKMPDPHTGVLDYESLDALLPGRDPNLDRICRIILEKEPICPPPTDEDKLRSEEDEIKWFNQTRSKQQSAESSEKQDQLIQKETTPRISVIIPCYDYGQYLREAVESVINQTFKNFEIIIVNDGSTDSTKEIAEQLIAEYSGYQIRIINQNNSGQPAISRNNGIKEARGEYILPLDADDKLAPQALQIFIDAMRDQPNERVVAFGWLQTFGMENHVEQNHYFDMNQLLRLNMLAYCSMYHKSVWELQNGYKTNVPGYEDWDFWVGAAEIGAKFINIPQVTVHYRSKDSPSMVTKAQKRHEWLVAGIIFNHHKIYQEDEVAWASGYLSRFPSPPEEREIHGPNDRFPFVSAVLVTNHPYLYSHQEIVWATQYLNEKLLQEISKQKWPLEVETLIARSGRHFIENSLENTHNILYQVRDSVPDEPDQIVTYGHIILRLGDVEGANREFEKAITLFPKYAPGYINKAAVLISKKKLQEAEGYLHTASLLDSSDFAVNFLFELLQNRNYDLQRFADRFLSTGKAALKKNEIDNIIWREISIVVPCYNQANFLYDCLKSLLAQTFVNWEAIVVDDYSTSDDPEKVVKKIGDDRIRIVRHEKNKGLAAARNTGFRFAKADLLLTIDADDMLSPDFLQKVFTAQREKPDTDCAFTDIQLFGAKEERWTYAVKDAEAMTKCQWIPGAGTLMRRNLWESVGGYSEAPELRPGNEDWDFWLGAVSLGIRAVYVSDALYLYRQHHTSMRNNLAYMDYHTRQFMYQRHYSLFDRFGTGSEFLMQGYINSAGEAWKRGEKLRALLLAIQGWRYSHDGPTSISSRNFNSGFEDAAKQFIGALNLYPDDARVWLSFGGLADQIIRTNGNAIDSFQRLLGDMQSIDEVKRDLGHYIHFDQQYIVSGNPNYEKQKQHYLSVLKTNPIDVELWLELAQYASENNDSETAKASFEATLSLDTSNLIACSYMANWAKKQNLYDEALAYLKQALDKNPDNEMLLNEVAQLTQETDDPKLVNNILDNIQKPTKDLSKLYKNEAGRELYWNIRADDIDKQWGAGQADYELLADIIKEINPDRILDIGCGSGRLFPLYERLQIVGVIGQDISQTALKIAQERYNYPNITLVNKPIEKLEYPESYFDLAISNRVLQHIPKESISLVIKTICYFSKKIYINESVKDIIDPVNLDFYMFLHNYVQLFEAHNFFLRREGLLGQQKWYLFEKRKME